MHAYNRCSNVYVFYLKMRKCENGREKEVQKFVRSLNEFDGDEAISTKTEADTEMCKKKELK